MITVYIIIALIVAILVVFALVIWFINNREERQIKNIPHYRHDVIISGGVDITTGQTGNNDHRYFNGMKENAFSTICLKPNQVIPTPNTAQAKHSIVLVEQSTGLQYYCYFNDVIVIGRVSDKYGYQTMVLTHDETISSRHCRISESGGRFYIEDLGSSNHTYVNHKVVTASQLLDTGDFLKIGKYTYQIFVN